MQNIAILGATSQIGKSLIFEFAPAAHLGLFARNTRALDAFLLAANFSPNNIITRTYNDFPVHAWDIIINAAGPGDPRVIQNIGPEIFRWTEYVDNLVLDYLAVNKAPVYFFLSSGSVYANGYRQAAKNGSEFCMPVNHISSDFFYPLAKIHAEAKHRASPDLRIADLRIFGYFSRFMNLDGGFLLAQLANCIAKGQEFRTTSRNFVRDYVGAKELAMLIRGLAENNAPNGPYDAISTEPTTKAEIIDCLSRKFDLRYSITDGSDFLDCSPSKPELISLWGRAQEFGYEPKRNSLEVIVGEMELILGKKSASA